MTANSSGRALERAITQLGGNASGEQPGNAVAQHQQSDTDQQAEHRSGERQANAARDRLAEQLAQQDQPKG